MTNADGHSSHLGRTLLGRWPWVIYMWMQAEKAVGSKPVCSALPRLLLQFQPPGSCLEFLSWLPFTMDYDLNVWAEINTFLPMLLWVMVFHHSDRNPKTFFIITPIDHYSPASFAIYVWHTYVHVLVCVDMCVSKAHRLISGVIFSYASS